MTFRELQERVAPLAAEIEKWAEFAEEDEFAPWVVECLRRATRYAYLSDAAVNECQADIYAVERACNARGTS